MPRVTNTAGSARYDIHWHFSRLSRILPATNHTYQNFSDGIEVGGVNKRIGAGIDKRHEHGHVVESALKSQSRNEHHEDVIDVERQPGDGVESADHYHGLDHAGLNVI